MLVAPVLAVISWFAVDRIVRPAPLAAQAGQSFPLLARSNCRYASGQCTLFNGDFRVDLHVRESRLVLVSEMPISAARVALVDSAGAMVFEADLLQATEPQPGLVLPSNPGSIAAVHLALNSAGVLYFVETQSAFLMPEVALIQ